MTSTRRRSCAERIARLTSDRTKLLAAISHDLRTPITRLRLRAEFIENEGNRKRMAASSQAASGG